MLHFLEGQEEMGILTIIMKSVITHFDDNYEMSNKSNKMLIFFLSRCYDTGEKKLTKFWPRSVTRLTHTLSNIVSLLILISSLKY